jgi:hypothetical protein
VKGRPASLIPRLLLPVVAVLAGCGGDGGPSAPAGPDPATLVPADAPLFAEGVVRPEDDRKEALDSALSKLLATNDPGAFVVEQLDKTLAGSDVGLTYRDDIEPWLGEQAGIFIETFTADADGAAILATTDTQAAEQAIEKAAAADEEPERRRSYEGVDYLLDRGGTAAGVVGDFLVTGSHNAFREAVDASTGRSLAESGDFKAQLDQAPDDWVGFAYSDPGAILDALRNSGQVTSAEVASGGPQLEALLSQPATASVSATSDELALQASAATGAAPAAQESPLLRDFPEDAWLAFAVSDAGQTYGRVLDRIRAGTGSGSPLGGRFGFDLVTQVARWAGDLGGFVGGTSLFGLRGALVVETSDEQASAQTLDELQRLLGNDPAVSVEPLTEAGEHGFSLTPGGAPIQFQVVQRGDKVVAGLADSVNDVFSPSSTLGDSDAFNSAADALDEGFAPVIFVDFVPLFELVDSFPQARSDPDYRSAKPYLDHLDYFVLGGRRDQDRAEVRMVLGLRDAPAQAEGDSGAAVAVVGNCGWRSRRARARPGAQQGSGSTCSRSGVSSGRWRGGRGSPSGCSLTASWPTRARGAVPDATSRPASQLRRPP